MTERDRVLAIYPRGKPEKHFEVHFDDRVEFWGLDGRKLGESKVEEVPA